MLWGIGLDIIEVERIARAIRQKTFIDRVFTDREQAYCDGRGVQRAASYAARFAGKEAVAKAFGTGFVRGTLRDIEIISGAGGCPQVNLYGYFLNLATDREIAKVYISLTHARQYAAAQALLWRGTDNEGGNG